MKAGKSQIQCKPSKCECAHTTGVPIKIAAALMRATVNVYENLYKNGDFERERAKYKEWTRGVLMIFEDSLGKCFLLRLLDQFNSMPAKLYSQLSAIVSPCFIY